MLSGLANRSGWGRALAALAFMAIAVRAIVPAGYMLAADSEPGRFVTVTLCSTHGSVDAVLDRETGDIIDAGDQPSTPSDNPDTSPCVFAAAAHLAAPEHAPAAISVAFAREALRFNAVEARPGLGLAAPPPFSTGPPLKA
jgi:hypothetical protein